MSPKELWKSPTKKQLSYVSKDSYLINSHTQSATKTITQLQYVEWPQNSVPSNPNSVIDMIDMIERVQRKTANGPITVHCR